MTYDEWKATDPRDSEPQEPEQDTEDPCADCKPATQDDCEFCSTRSKWLNDHPQPAKLYGPSAFCESPHSNVGRGIRFDGSSMRKAIEDGIHAIKYAKGKPVKLRPEPPVIVPPELLDAIEAIDAEDSKPLVECDECLYRRFPWQTDGAASWCYMFHQRVDGCRAGARAKPLKPTVVVNLPIKDGAELTAGDVPIVRSDGTVEALKVDGEAEWLTKVSLTQEQLTSIADKVHLINEAKRQDDRGWYLRSTLERERDGAVTRAIWHLAQFLGCWASFRWRRACLHGQEAAEATERAVRLTKAMKDGETQTAAMPQEDEHEN